MKSADFRIHTLIKETLHTSNRLAAHAQRRELLLGSCAPLITSENSVAFNAPQFRNEFRSHGSIQNLPVIYSTPERCASSVGQQKRSQEYEVEQQHDAGVLAAKDGPGIFRREPRNRVNHVALVEDRIVHTTQVGFSEVGVVQ